MYEFDARIRYSEVGIDKKLKLTALMNYFQDCSTFQSEDLGVGLDYLYSLNQAWVVNYWQIDIIKMPQMGDKVIVGTNPYRLKGFMGHRNFYMKDAKTGEYLAKANSIWTLIDIKEIKPVRANQKMIEAYVVSDPLDMEYLDRKINLEGEEKVLPALSVVKENLDTNNHVNNEQYIQMASLLLPEEFEVHRLLVEYRKSAYLGDTIVPKVVTNDEYVGVSLDDTLGAPFVKVRFS